MKKDAHLKKRYSAGKSLIYVFFWLYWRLSKPFVVAFSEAHMGYGEGQFKVDGRQVYAKVTAFLKQLPPQVFEFFMLAVATVPLYVPPALPRNPLRRALVEFWYALKSAFGRFVFVLQGRKRRSLWIETMYRRLIQQAPEQADQVVKTIVSLQSFRTVLASAYLDEKRIWDALDYQPVHQRSFDPPTGPDLATPPPSPQGEMLKREARRPSEVAKKPPGKRTYCVIGSGAGGAVAAHRIQQLEPDARIVLIEAGPLTNNDDYARQQLTTAARLYMNAGVTLTQNQLIYLVQGRAVGGSTLVNNAVAFKPEGFWWDENIVDQWRSLGVNLDYPDLHAQYDPLLERLHVGPADEEPEIISQMSRTIRDGWTKLKEAGRIPPSDQVVPAPINTLKCIGCGRCNYACQYEAKQSMLNTLIPELVEKGGLLVPQAQVTKLLFDRDAPPMRVRAVRAVTPDGEVADIECDRCVVAPGAYASTKLLWKSGFTGAAAGVRTVGKRFSINAGTPLIGIFPEGTPQDGFNGQQVGYALEIQKERIIIETSFAPPGAVGQSLNVWGDEFQVRVRQLNRIAAAVPVLGTLAYGEIKRGLLGQSGFVVDFNLIEQDWIRFQRGLRVSAEAMFEMGAEEVFINRFNGQSLRRDAGPVAFEAYFSGLGPSDFIPVISGHLQGGNVIGPQPFSGVVDTNLKVYGMENCWVCDASVIPAPITLNIAFTVMALARYAAPRIVNDPS